MTENHLIPFSMVDWFPEYDVVYRYKNCEIGWSTGDPGAIGDSANWFVKTHSDQQKQLFTERCREQDRLRRGRELKSAANLAKVSERLREVRAKNADLKWQLTQAIECDEFGEGLTREQIDTLLKPTSGEYSFISSVVDVDLSRIISEIEKDSGHPKNDLYILVKSDRFQDSAASPNAFQDGEGFRYEFSHFWTGKVYWSMLEEDNEITVKWEVKKN